MAEYDSLPARQARTRGYSDDPASSSLASPLQPPTRRMSLTRPPRSEQRRSQVYAAELVLTGDEAVAPVLLPPVTAQRLSSLPRNSSESSLSGMRRSTALRDVSLGREGSSPSRDAYGGGPQPHTPRSARASEGSQRGSPDPWFTERERTPTSGSSDGRNATPRQASPHTPRQRESSGGSSSPLHQPPILLSRTSLSSRYSSPTQSNSFRANTPSSDRHGSSGQTKAEASSSESEYSLDDDSSESQGWTGIDMPGSSSPPKSPLLAQTLAEARRHHSFASMTGALQDDAMEDIDSVGAVPRRGSVASLGLRSLSRNGSVDASMADEMEMPTRRGSITDQRSRTASNRQSIAEDKGLQVAWWTAGLADPPEDPDPPHKSVDSLSHAEFQAVVLGASPDPDAAETQGVGTVVDWDDSEPARPATPQPSTYQPRRPSMSPSSRPIDLTAQPSPSPSDPLPATPDRSTFDHPPHRAASAGPEISPSTSSTSQQSHRPSPISIPAPQEVQPSARPSSRSGLRTSQEEDRNRLSPNRAAFASSVNTSGPPPVALPKASNGSPQADEREQESSTAVKTSSSPLPPLPSPLPPLSPLTENYPSTSTTNLAPTESPASSSPSPRRQRKDLPPPPEKSRKRASTLRRTSRQPGDEPPPSPRPPSEMSEAAKPAISHHSSSSSSEFTLGALQDSATTPVTPLSASDFAEAYGGKEFGRSSSIDLNISSAPSSSHIRSPAIVDSPTVTPAPQTPSPLLPVGAERDAAGSQDPHYGSRMSRSDSLTMMADLNAQLSEAISNVHLGDDGDRSGGGAATKRALHATQQQEDDASKRLSEAPSEDIYHDAPTTSGNGTASAALSLGASPQLPPLPTDDSPARSRPTSPSLSKPDAKTRAAAFVADLKRARAAAGAGAASTTSSPPSLPFASPSLSFPASSPAATSPSSHVPDSFHTPHQAGDSPSDFTAPPPPRSASFARDIPTPPSLPTSTNASPQIPLHSASPPPPPPRSNMDRRTSESRLPDLPKSPALPPTLPALPASPALPSTPAVRLDRLHRRRPLPGCLSIAPELKKARTPGDRALIYAAKINQLRKESSGVSEWISAARGPTGTSNYTSPVQGSPGRSRRDASSASFPSRGDGYKAREIPNGSFSPRDLTPSVPFPGVLSHPPSSSSVRSFASLSKPPSASHNKSFFSGLGRKASKRSISGSLSGASGGGGLGPISGPQAGSLSTTSQRPSITSLNISQPSSVSSASGRPLGPRMPGTSRASMDVNMYSSPSPSTSPNLTGGGLPSRASFSYGSSSGSTPLPLLSSSSASGSSVTAVGSMTGPVDEDKLERLSNILPLAGREDLVAALSKAGGDEVLAVSVFLSDEATRKQ